ncbi:MAG: SusD/RagB family nutrient-binding outer membrane lipoprotein [Leadbetterella sp.]
MKINLYILSLVLIFVSCKEEFETFPTNPNVAGETGAVPPEYLFRQILTDVRLGADQPEEPFSSVSRLNQYTTGLTFPLYGGSNLYNWTNTGDTYGWIRNINKLNENAERALGKKNNAYLTLGKFLKVYSYVWLTQRVGDIPVFESGKGLENPTPTFDNQEEIYLYALNTLDEVNKELSVISTDATSPKINGDIYYNNNLTAWRRAVNAYQLRVLISLSKRVQDSPKLQIKERFAKIINTPAEYPLYRDNADNWSFTFLPVTNRYPTQFLRLYALETTVSKTFLDILKNNKDPRMFIVATPAPGQMTSGKKVDDFEAYNGSDNSRAQGQLFSESDGTKGQYSYVNYIRYLRGPDFIPEQYIISGYAEMCFNIAEAANRGWLEVDASKYYEDGIKASLKFYGVEQGKKLTISNGTGLVIGEATANTNDFLVKVKYAGNNEEGLKQILEQKYVAFWQNSGWEPYYQYRRTGIPTFSEGAGTNSQGKIPVKWLYPIREVVNNAENAKKAIDKQFSGKDDIFAKMWLIQ